MATLTALNESPYGYDPQALQIQLYRSRKLRTQIYEYKYTETILQDLYRCIRYYDADEQPCGDHKLLAESKRSILVSQGRYKQRI